MRAFLILILSCIAVAAQQVHVQYKDEPTAAPKRMVGNAVYDVSRQTNLWKVTTMTYVRPQIYLGGWVVMAKIDDTNSFFVLRNPPTEELQRFIQFKALYQQAKFNYEQLQAEYQNAVTAHEEAKLLVSELKADPPTKVGTKQEMRWAKDLYKAEDDEKTYDQQSSILGARAKAAKENLDRITSSGFNIEGDAFVFTAPIMRVPLKVENMPVYDRGQIIPY